MAPDAAPAAPLPPRRRVPPGVWVLGVLGLLGLLGVLGVLAGLPGAGPAPTPVGPVRDGTGSPRALYFQAADGSIAAWDATSGITRTLRPAGAFVTRLLAVSPDETRIALIETTRPLTATTWYLPISETLRVAQSAAPAVRVPLGEGPLMLSQATFMSNDLLLVVGQDLPQNPEQLYLYNVADGSSQLVARRVRNVRAMPELGLVLYEDVPSDPSGSPARGTLTLVDVVQPTPRPVGSDTPLFGSGTGPMWSDPAYRTVFFTNAAPAPAIMSGQAAQSDHTLFALPVRPLGTPYAVATFTSESLSTGAQVPASGRYFQWPLPRPTSLPGTQRAVAFQTPAPQRLAGVVWDAAGRATLQALPLPLTPTGQMQWAGDSDVLVDQAGNFLGVPPLANPTTTPGVPALTTLQLYDPGTGRLAQVPAALRVQWRGADGADAAPVQATRDGRLLLAGLAGQATPPPAGLAPTALALLLGQPTADGWAWTALGALPAPLGTRALVLQYYGLTADGSAVLLGVPPPVPAPAQGGYSPGLTLTRVPLDGGPWHALAVLAAEAPVLLAR